MNPLQEKLNEMVESYEEIVQLTGLIPTKEFFRKDLTTIINLTLEEAKKAVVTHSADPNQAVEALDKMKLK